MPRGATPRPAVRTTEEVAALVEEHAPLARWYAGQWTRLHPGLDWDEVMQEATIGLWRAARIWDPTRGKFGGYAVGWMRSRLRRHLQNWLADRARMLSLDAITPDPRAHPPDAAMLAAEVEDALRVLPARDRDVIEGLAEGKTCRDLAEGIGVSYQRVGQIAQRARERLARHRPDMIDH